jgi:stage V sporulation protein G
VEITEVRVKLMEDGSDRLKAFCSITFDDCFVIRDLKIIEGTSGPFVAMPSRKLTSHCPECGCKNHLRADFCNQCGLELPRDRAGRDDEGRAKLYADIAHPINSECREMIQDRVIKEFEAELERAQEPGYVSRYDEFDFDGPEPHFETSRARQPEPRKTEAETRSAGKKESAPRVEPPQQKSRGPHTEQKPKSDAPKGSQHRAPDSFGEGIF